MSDWDAAWSAMARTDEETAAEARAEVERSERQQFEREYEEWLDAQERDYGSAFDGRTVTSDADPGL